MTVGVVSAMEEEIALYRDRCSIRHSVTWAGPEVLEARHEGHDVVLVRSGVGKVNAAMTTQFLLDEFGVDVVLCTGSAGALHDGIEIGDIVVGEDCLQHDLHVKPLGLPRGQIPFSDLRVFESDPSLVERAMTVELPDHTVHTGRILTGDSFLHDADARTALRDGLGGACVEMEGAAVGHVCTVHDVPFLVVRAISDRADGTSNVDFQSFLEEASRSSARIVLHLLALLGAERGCP